MYVFRQKDISSSVAEIESATGSQGDCCQKDDCRAIAAGRKADGAERDHPEKALTMNTSSLPVYVVTEHHQCLVVSAHTDEDIKVQVILDTGASTSLVGKGFLEKRKMKNLKPLQIEELPRKFQITGVSSNSPVNCKGTVEFGLKFSGESKGILRFRALVVTEWEGDVILSWNALDMMGINFIRDKETGRTTHIQLSRVDTVAPVVRKYDKSIAEKARQLTAKIDRAVQEDTIEALKNRIIFGEALKPKDRRERSRWWKHETRQLRKAITPQGYKNLCQEAGKTRAERLSGEASQDGQLLGSVLAGEAVDRKIESDTDEAG